MAIVGRYCKAYPIGELRTFSDWSEKSENVRKDVDPATGEMGVAPRLTEEGYLFVQENYVVTDGIFMDENIIFEDVTPEWKSFCHDTLGFQIPE